MQARCREAEIASRFVATRREMEALGLRWIKTEKGLPWQHVMFFEKP